MRVVVVGGRSRADYLIGALRDNGDHVLAINADKQYCQYLASRHDVGAVWGDGTKLKVLRAAGIARYDAVVALTSSDADNLVICQLAKRFFQIPLQLCTVVNPENVGNFRRLGVTAAISGTAALARAIEDAVASTTGSFHLGGRAGRGGELFEEEGRGELRASAAVTSAFHRIKKV